MKPWIRSFIGLGGNLDNPQQRIQNACDQLGEIRLCRREKVSSLYISEPLRGDTNSSTNQPNYINAVVELYTQLSAEQLLDELQQLEQQHGRTRSHSRWQSRTLDLDILLFGNQQTSSERLQIPHPELMNRNFVVLPLSEITDNLRLPSGASLQDAVNKPDFEPLKIVAQYQPTNQPVPQTQQQPQPPTSLERRSHSA